MVSCMTLKSWIREIESIAALKSKLNVKITAHLGTLANSGAEWFAENLCVSEGQKPSRLDGSCGKRPGWSVDMCSAWKRPLAFRRRIMTIPSLSQCVSSRSRLLSRTYIVLPSWRGVLGCTVIRRQDSRPSLPEGSRPACVNRLSGAADHEIAFLPSKLKALRSVITLHGRLGQSRAARLGGSVLTLFLATRLYAARLAEVCVSKTGGAKSYSLSANPPARLHQQYHSSAWCGFQSVTNA